MLFCSLLVLLATFGQSSAQSWACPSQPVRSGPYYVPYSSKAPVAIPSNYKCDYKFEIPVGMVLRMMIKSHIDQADSYSYTDSQGFINPLPSDANNVVKAIAAFNGTFSLSTTSTNSVLLAKFEWVDPSQGKLATPRQTGRFLDLNDLNSNVITIKSQRYRPIQLTVAVDPLLPNDAALGDVFVYEGDSVNSNFIGTLADDDVVSKYSALTLVNAAGSTSSSYLVANDVDMVQQYDSYSATLLRQNRPPRADAISSFTKTTAVTYILPDGSDLYFQRLAFNATFTSGVGQVFLFGGAPDPSSDVLVTYSLGTGYTSSAMPQHFPGSLVTMVVDWATVDVAWAATCADYGLATDGRNGYIFSPSVVTDNTYSNFQFAMDGGSTTFDFTTQLISYVSGGFGQYLEILVNDANQQITFNQTFTTTANARSPQTGRGTKLRVNLVNEGLRGAGAKLNYKVALPAK